VKMTQGYVTDDGTFFESKLEAELHEAETRLRAQLAIAYPKISQEMFLQVVFELRSQLRSYIDAYNTATATKLDQPAQEPDRAETVNGGATEAAGGIGHVSSTEEDLASLLKLPPRGPSHVPNVGGSPRSKKVSDRRQKHGA
jgi:hypothetical protein